MATALDFRGLACPQPVLRTRNAMMESDNFDVLVSDAAQVGNITRMAERSGWTVKSTQSGSYFTVQLSKGESSVAVPFEAKPEELTCDTSQITRGSVICIVSNQMGKGDPDLGQILMKAFINTLLSCSPKPECIVFYNSGVQLAVDGSRVLEDLQELQSQGVEMLVCGTCLEFFRKKDAIQVGVISNMFDIATRLLDSSNVITI